LARKAQGNFLIRVLLNPFTQFGISIYLGFCLLQAQSGGQAEFLGSMGTVVGFGLTAILGLSAWLLPVATGFIALCEIRGQSLASRTYYRILGLVIISAVIIGSADMGGGLGGTVWAVLEYTLGKYISLAFLLLFFAFCLAPKEMKQVFYRLNRYLRSTFSVVPGNRTAESSASSEGKLDGSEVIIQDQTTSHETQANNEETRINGHDDLTAPEIGGQSDQPEPTTLEPDPVQKYGDERPDLDFLHASQEETDSREEVKETSARIDAALKKFEIKGKVEETVVGPMVATYFVSPKGGTKISELERHLPDISRFLGHPEDAVRLNLDIAGREGKIAVEVPIFNRRIIGLRDLIKDTSTDSAEMLLPLRIGIDTLGSPVCIDLAQLPHLLVAGSTGSGKSIAINSLIVSLLYHGSPDSIQLVLIDPKMVEFSHFTGLPHLSGEVITETDQAVAKLNGLTEVMDERYRVLRQSGKKNISEFNEIKGNPSKMPSIVVVIDELADLLMEEGKLIEGPVVRLAQKARAAGIHLILATQRPTADIITGLIKTNVPGRLTFRVASKVDSNVILNQKGAEALQGKGDGLFLNPAAKGLTRIQAPMVSVKEIERIKDFWKHV